MLSESPDPDREEIVCLDARALPSVPTRLLYVDHVEARGRDFFEVACAHDLEGIVGSSRPVATMRTGRARMVQGSRILRTPK